MTELLAEVERNWGSEVAERCRDLLRWLQENDFYLDGGTIRMRDGFAVGEVILPPELRPKNG